MFYRSKGFLFTAIALSCAAMMLPSQAEARGGGGGGRGGGGGGRGGFGGFSRGGGFSGSAYRGFSGATAGSRFTPANPGSGAWRGNWNNYGRWGYPGWGWGWGIGLGYWGFGYPYWYGGYPFWYPTLAYGAYWNPYYTNAYDYGGYNYGVPIQQSQNNPEGAQDSQYFAEARAAFYAGNYPEALRNIEHAAVDQPNNEDIHQFHALVLFALGDYQKAAAVAHTVLDRGPGWNWSVVQSFYPSPDTYTQQLRKLEHSITEHPDQPATRFLLAYEYLTLGHFQAADRQLQKVVALEPKDVLAKNILNALNNAPGVKPNALPGTGSQPQGMTSTQKVPPSPPQGPPAPPQGPPAAPPSIGPTPAITGSWTASPAPGVTIKTVLQPDKHFTWTFTEGGQTTTFTGTYTQQGDDLKLTRDQDGQTMDGTVTMNENGGFRFRLKNTDPNDVGLQFTK